MRLVSQRVWRHRARPHSCLHVSLIETIPVSATVPCYELTGAGDKVRPACVDISSPSTVGRCDVGFLIFCLPTCATICGWQWPYVLLLLLLLVLLVLLFALLQSHSSSVLLTMLCVSVALFLFFAWILKQMRPDHTRLHGTVL